MNEVDFTSDLWLFGSPWTKHLERHRYFDAIARAWVATLELHHRRHHSHTEADRHDL